MKKMLLCSILIMSMLCSCSGKSSSKSQTEMSDQTVHVTKKAEFQKIDMFENVELVNALEFDKCSFNGLKDGMHNIYPLSATWDIYDNPYLNEYAKEYGIDDIYELRWAYDMDLESLSVTAHRATITLKFDYKDGNFDEFLEKHNYKIASYTKEYSISPEECESEILNEDMYTTTVAKDVDRIINEEISKNEDYCDYEIFQKYLMLPADEYDGGFSGGIFFSPWGWNMDNGIDASIELELVENCNWGMIAILKDKNSESYIRARLKVIVKDERVIDSLFTLASDRFEDREMVDGELKIWPTIYTNANDCYDGIENNCDNLHTVDLSKINKYVAVDY